MKHTWYTQIIHFTNSAHSLWFFIFVCVCVYDFMHIVRISFPHFLFCLPCCVLYTFFDKPNEKNKTKQNTKEIHTLQATRAAVSFFSTPEQVKLPWIIATRRRGAKGKPYGGRKEAIPFDLLSFSLIHFSLSLFFVCLIVERRGNLKKKKRPPTTVTTFVRLYVTLTSLFIVFLFFFSLLLGFLFEFIISRRVSRVSAHILFHAHKKLGV